MAWVKIRAYLAKVDVQRFINTAFSDPLNLGEDNSLDWEYLLKATIQYPEATGGTVSEMVLYLTERVGGSTQYINDNNSCRVQMINIFNFCW